MYLQKVISKKKDPYQNVTDTEHWLLHSIIFYVLGATTAAVTDQFEHSEHRSGCDYAKEI